MLDLSRLSCLGEALRDGVSAFKSRPALFEADRYRETAQLSYAQLKQEAERVGALLQAHGLDVGGRCAILMSNQSKWVITSFGALWSGAVLVPLDYKLTPPEQLRLLQHSKARVLVTEYPVWLDLQAAGLSQALPELVALVTETPEGADLGAALRWEAPAERPHRYVTRARSDVASIVYSSGTSGEPKGCMLTHEAYLCQAEVLGCMFPMELEDRYLSVLPTNHAIDFMCGAVVPFLFGAAVVHQRTLRAEFLAPTMQRYGVTHVALVPRILRTLKERIEEQLDALPSWQRQAIDSAAALNALATVRVPRPFLSRTLLRPIQARLGGKLRVIFAGGAFVEPELADFFYRLGLPVAIGYGLTEACTVLTVNDLSPYRADSVGKPVRGVTLELRDVGVDGVGEVYAQSRTLMVGYLDAPELTRETLVDGFLRTGDLGLIDASGHLKLVGRCKNMIVTQGGKNVYPEDVEAALEALPCEELCVLSSSTLWPGSGLGSERIVLVARLKPSATEASFVRALRDCNQRLAEHKRVRSYALTGEEMPRTASLKIKRAELARVVRAAGLFERRLEEGAGAVSQHGAAP